ncbi:DUF86 domain-containing protein [Actinomyces sp.]|uniref:DUF86 domain-containing protein n=1 Tax=Actinomyces sp. TaxID=29317 RepID=UPI0034C6DEB8
MELHGTRRSGKQSLPGFREAHPEIVWHRPISLHNRIIHGYWSIDIDVLVTTAQRDLPDLAQRLDKLLSAAHR